METGVQALEEAEGLLKIGDRSRAEQGVFGSIRWGGPGCHKSVSLL